MTVIATAGHLEDFRDVPPYTFVVAGAAEMIKAAADEPVACCKGVSTGPRHATGSGAPTPDWRTRGAGPPPGTALRRPATDVTSGSLGRGMTGCPRGTILGRARAQRPFDPSATAGRAAREDLFMTYSRTVRRSRIAALVIVALTAVGLVGGWLLDEVRGPRFAAETNVLVQFGQVQGFLLTGQSSGVTTQDVADVATLATSPDVLDLAARRLGGGQDGTDLTGEVTATSASLSNGFTVTATGATSAAARRLSALVAEATADVQRQRISESAASLSELADGDLKRTIQQRAQVLLSSVPPIQVLRTAAATSTRSAVTTTIMMGIVGLAAGVLLVVGYSFARPVVSRPRDAQRLTELPSVAFEEPHGGGEVSRLVRRLLDVRGGDVVLVPVTAAACKSAELVAEWARDRTESAAEAARIVVAPEPVAAVLDPRPPAGGSAVVLVVPQGVASRALSDALGLLSTWRAPDAVVVTG